VYFDRYVLFDREHRTNDDNQLKTMVMVRNRANLLEYLENKIIFSFDNSIQQLTLCVRKM
jgi:hypothetical protein